MFFMFHLTTHGSRTQGLAEMADCYVAIVTITVSVGVIGALCEMFWLEGVRGGALEIWKTPSYPPAAAATAADMATESRGCDFF